jgi:hypothetical protein
MNKSELNYDELIKSQKTTKPNIEDVIGNFLESDALKNALDFIAYLRENNMNPRWSSANSWKVTGKGKPICKINLGGAKGPWHNHMNLGDWQIYDLENMGREYMDEFSSCDETKEFIWANIKPCNKCSCCGPRSWTYIGKQFDNCCTFTIKNPDKKGLEFAKKLVEANKRFIYANMS